MGDQRNHHHLALLPRARALRLPFPLQSYYPTDFTVQCTTGSTGSLACAARRARRGAQAHGVPVHRGRAQAPRRHHPRGDQTQARGPQAATRRRGRARRRHVRRRTAAPAAQRARAFPGALHAQCTGAPLSASERPNHLHIINRFVF